MAHVESTVFLRDVAYHERVVGHCVYHVQRGVFMDIKVDPGEDAVEVAYEPLPSRNGWGFVAGRYKVKGVITV